MILFFIYLYCCAMIAYGIVFCVCVAGYNILTYESDDYYKKLKIDLEKNQKLYEKIGLY